MNRLYTGNVLSKNHKTLSKDAHKHVWRSRDSLSNWFVLTHALLTSESSSGYTRTFKISMDARFSLEGRDVIISRLIPALFSFLRVLCIVCLVNALMTTGVLCNDTYSPSVCTELSTPVYSLFSMHEPNAFNVIRLSRLDWIFNLWRTQVGSIVIQTDEPWTAVYELNLGVWYFNTVQNMDKFPNGSPKLIIQIRYIKETN